MKSKKTQNIQIAEILSYYTANNLRKYSPEALKQELHDLRVLFSFSSYQVPKICSDLRKKMNEAQKLVNEIASSAAFMETEFLNKPAANLELAYKILSMSAQPLVTTTPTPKIINQLKLKFLQSKNVSIKDWYAYFRSESCTLAIRIPQQKAQVVIAVRQKELKNEMEWAIIQAFIGSQRSPELFSFFLAFWQWSMKNSTECAVTLIDDIKQLLKNVCLIKIFLELRKMWKNKEQLDSIKYTSKTKNGQLIAVNWKFDFFSLLGSPQITIEINGKKMIELTASANKLKGKLTLGFTEDNQPITLFLNHQQIPLIHSFVNLPQTICNFDKSLILFFTKNKLQFKENCKIVASVMEGNWIPQDLNPKELEKIQPEGIWVYLKIERGVFLHIEHQGNLSSKSRERALATLLAQKQVGLQDMGRHISLQEFIFADNSSYQFKFYEFKIEDNDVQAFIQYEFRSMRYSMNQRHSRLTRVQQNYLQEETSHNDNYFIKVKISLDFTKIQFLLNKYQQGRRIDRPEEDIEKQYLKKDWKDYKDSVQVGARLSWVKVAEAIGYLCRCFVPQRLKLKMLKANQRRNAHLDLN